MYFYFIQSFDNNKAITLLNFIVSIYTPYTQPGLSRYDAKSIAISLLNLPITEFDIIVELSELGQINEDNKCITTREFIQWFLECIY